MTEQSTLLKQLDFEAVSLDETAKNENGMAKQAIVLYWPNAKIVLQAIAAMIQNPVVKIIISSVESLGDALYNKFKV